MPIKRSSVTGSWVPAADLDLAGMDGKGNGVDSPVLHHVAITTGNLERSLAFYSGILGLRQIDRPPFDIAGAWLVSGSCQVHLINHPSGTFRTSNIVDINDIHVALRVADFEETLRLLASKGFREDAPEGDPMRLVVRRKGVAGFPQAYFLDPDLHIVEINAAN
jgi:catechol 2,3-dioxygenase-like lactoylglutathione lyase family enzyme